MSITSSILNQQPLLINPSMQNRYMFQGFDNPSNCDVYFQFVFKLLTLFQKETLKNYEGLPNDFL